MLERCLKSKKFSFLVPGTSDRLLWESLKRIPKYQASETISGVSRAQHLQCGRHLGASGRSSPLRDALMHLSVFIVDPLRVSGKTASREWRFPRMCGISSRTHWCGTLVSHYGQAVHQGLGLSPRKKKAHPRMLCFNPCSRGYIILCIICYIMSTIPIFLKILSTAYYSFSSSATSLLYFPFPILYGFSLLTG